jgi:hypothetical protein
MSSEIKELVEIIKIPNDPSKQGALANKSGQEHEEKICEATEILGCTNVSYVDLRDNKVDLSSNKYLSVSQPHFTNIYGGKSRADLLIIFNQNRIRIEAKRQEGAGSVVEKFPFVMENLEQTEISLYPENFSILVIEGKYLLENLGLINYIQKRVDKFNKKNTHKKLFLAKGQKELEDLIIGIEEGKITL